jgi:V8-like Glu-specific endopeptidase
MRLHTRSILLIAVASFCTASLADTAPVSLSFGAEIGKITGTADNLTVPPEIMRSTGKQKAQISTAPIASKLPRAPSQPLEKLGSARLAAKEKLRQLQAWNRGENIPVQNGFARPLENPVNVSLGPEARQLASQGMPKAMHRGQVSRNSETEVFWTAAVDAEEAHGLRLHLQADGLPDDVQMWVYGENDDYIGPFGAELLDSEGGLWTPSVGGSRISLVVQLSASARGIHFNIDKVAELFQLDSSGEVVFEPQATLPSCLEDSQCFNSSTYAWIRETEASVAIIRFAKNDSFFQCTGGLIADADGSSQILYFLTANHCLKTQDSATSLEAFWDYKRIACNGSAPNLYSVPRSNGSTLLATGTNGDYTLLQLHNVPPGRWFMGWDANPQAISAGAILHRVSYPGGQPASYSQSRVNQAAACGPGYIYQTPLLGGLIGGSSGSPVFSANGRIVGQLFGNCGSNSDTCAYSTYQAADGALNTYFSAVAQWLNPPVAPATPQNISASDGAYSFKVQISWTDWLGEDNYELYRCSNTSTASCGAAIVSTGADTSSYDDTGAAADGTVYYYRLKACNAYGCSAFSAADSGFRAQQASNSELHNIATRADVRTGNDITIAGFIIKGNTQKCVVVQGLGPSVGVPAGVTRLPDPILTLKSGQTTIAQNDNWQVQDNPADATAIMNLGGSFVPDDIMEAAIYKCLNPGAYTALLTGYSDTTGVGIVAAYDADDGVPYLANIATRSWVGTGHLISIAGFVIKGNQPKQILVRGIGPSMQSSFPSGARVLSNPQLQLYRGSELIATNDDWGNASNASEISALPSNLRPKDSRESAILMVLEPGLYTAHLLGVSGGTGNGMVGVDDLTGR